MSFLTYVLIPADAKSVESTVTKLLSPYDGNLQVPEYDRRCECIELKAHEKARSLAVEKFGVADDDRPLLERMTIPLNPTPEQKELMELNRQRSRYRHEQYEQLVKKETSASDCELCQGTGLVKSTENPNGRLGHWEIGGKFGDVLKECSGSRVSTGAYAPIRDLDLSSIPIPGAIITPDGEWHEEFDEIQWTNKARDILAKHQDSVLVVVDCHS